MSNAHPLKLKGKSQGNGLNYSVACESQSRLYTLLSKKDRRSVETGVSAKFIREFTCEDEACSRINFRSSKPQQRLYNGVSRANTLRTGPRRRARNLVKVEYFGVFRPTFMPQVYTTRYYLDKTDVRNNQTSAWRTTAMNNVSRARIPHPRFLTRSEDSDGCSPRIIAALGTVIYR